MILETIHLGDLYPFLREKGRDPVLRAYLPDTIPETEGRKRPGLLIVPGGGYGVCTPREEEPIALKFLPKYMSKVFKQEVGMLPNEYRRMNT